MDELQNQYNLIHSFFKTTNEPYDYLNWSGEKLLVFLKGKIIEQYTFNDLKSIIEDFK
jgi:hypothetical protein